ncbi:phosphotransferase family protein [Henriciella mobilis]|uniref:phosphotransferase family protein n=1 Tax=Henriciella mobilis TaxID=2305467 RepID=UPI001F27F88B|nr:phosphotransferase family protein [Henriciella mobilis]
MELLFFPLIVAKMSDLQEFRQLLQTVLKRVYGDKLRVDDVNRLSGGASQETWLMNLSGGSAPETLILRRAPQRSQDAPSSAAIGLPNEAKIIGYAEKAGVPVPNVVYVLQEHDGLGEGYFMSRVPGETIARRILREDRYAEARSALPAQCGQALAGIHSIGIGDDPALNLSQGLDQLSQYEDFYLSLGACRPIFDLAMVWLRENAPDPLTPVLLHGDFRLGNIMVDETGLAAVLDWELCHLGDPREDIAWMCTNSWRFGNIDKRLGGFGDLEHLLDAYAADGGPVISPKDIDWWEMMGSVKWGVMCMMMYESFRTGAEPTVERAAIGRRVSETEMDLIRLLEAQRHA